MTTDNQITAPNEMTIEEATFSKATNLGRRTLPIKAMDKSVTLKTLSLRPTKSVKKNNSFKPTKKLR